MLMVVVFIDIDSGCAHGCAHHQLPVVVDLALKLTIAHVSQSVAYANHSLMYLAYLNLGFLCLPIHVNPPAHLNPKPAHIPRQGEGHLVYFTLPLLFQWIPTDFHQTQPIPMDPVDSLSDFQWNLLDLTKFHCLSSPSPVKVW